MSIKKFTLKKYENSSNKYVHVRLSSIEAVYEQGNDSVILLGSGEKIFVNESAYTIVKEIERYQR